MSAVRYAGMWAVLLAGTAWAQQEQGGADQALAVSRKTGRPLLVVVGSES
jgi:hypothetical protein